MSRRLPLLLLPTLAAMSCGPAATDPAPAPAMTWALENAPGPQACGAPCGCLGVGARYDLDPATGTVQVDATVVCGLWESAAPLLLVEPLDDPRASHALTLTMTDYWGEIGAFEGTLEPSGDAVRLTVVQCDRWGGLSFGPDGCVAFGTSRWALSESAVLAPRR